MSQNDADFCVRDFLEASNTLHTCTYDNGLKVHGRSFTSDSREQNCTRERLCVYCVLVIYLI